MQSYKDNLENEEFLSLYFCDICCRKSRAKPVRYNPDGMTVCILKVALFEAYSDLLEREMVV